MLPPEQTEAFRTIVGMCRIPPCHPTTRKEVIHVIKVWAARREAPSPIFWLAGPAGSGKSVVARTIGDYLQQCGRLGGRIAFSATSSGQDAKFLAQFLVQQLFNLAPSTMHSIYRVLAAEPDICEKPLSHQLIRLIAKPLTPNQGAGVFRPRVIIIDGLDACLSHEHESRRNAVQLEILHALASIAINFPHMRILITSRPRANIKEYLNSRGVRKHCLRVDLGNTISQRIDIERFLKSELSRRPIWHRFVPELAERCKGSFETAKEVLDTILEAQRPPSVDYIDQLFDGPMGRSHAHPRATQNNRREVYSPR